MGVRLRLFDESTAGHCREAGGLALDSATITVRELIRERIRSEVEAYNQSLPPVFQGLVQPEESERVLNGFRLRSTRPLDWHKQYERAVRSFEANGFLVIVGDRQVTDLDEALRLTDDEKVRFLKLVPLVGG